MNKISNFSHALVVYKKKSWDLQMSLRLNVTFVLCMCSFGHALKIDGSSPISY